MALALVVGACSNAASVPSASPSPGAACPTTPAPAGTPDGWDVATQRPTVLPQIINPSGTLACGPSRLMFSFLDADNVPVAAPDREVEVALYDLGADAVTPADTVPAAFIWAIEPTVGVYVVDADFPTAGLWGAELRTTVGGGEPETIRIQFDVQVESSVVAVGDPAPASDTPTLDDVGGDVTKISTDADPVRGVLHDVGHRTRWPPASRSCSRSRRRSSAPRPSADRPSTDSSPSRQPTRT